MAVFRAQINYTDGATQKWSNVWHCNAPDLITAADAWETDAVPSLRPLLQSTCVLASILISSLTDSTFITRPINLAGNAVVGGELLPLFNSLKVYLVDDSNGRPDYKYFKGYLTELLQIDGDVAAAAITAATTNILAMAAAMNTANAPLVSIQNDQYVGVNVAPRVQMRQMHRKRRRTVTP